MSLYNIKYESVNFKSLNLKDQYCFETLSKIGPIETLYATLIYEVPLAVVEGEKPLLLNFINKITTENRGENKHKNTTRYVFDLKHTQNTESEEHPV